MINYKNYDTNLDNLINQLDEIGIVVIPNVLSKSEINSSQNEMWEALNYLTQDFDLPLKYHNKDSWNTYYHLCPIEDMVLQYWKIGHSKYVWELRQNIKILEIFSKIWDCKIDDLLVSFDGVSIHFPPEITNTGKYQEDKNNWYHFDQSSYKKGRHCIQSFINLYDVNEGDSTLSIYEKSHLFHEKFFDHYQLNVEKDWYKLNNEQLDFFKNCSENAVLASAGSLVLWDSRILHQGILCSKYRKQPSIRSVVYICMIPRCKCDKKELERKKQAFKSLRMTTHWPNKINRFPAYPKKKESDGKNIHLIREIEPPLLNKIGYRLAGL